MYPKKYLTIRQIFMRSQAFWDSPLWYRANCLQAAFDQLGFPFIPLPAYSSDLNPIEISWQSMQKDVSSNCRHDYIHNLVDTCKTCVDRVSATS